MKRFSISKASQKIGCHSSTLRNYEAKGLFKAVRDRNGYRIYSENDIQKLSEIMYPESRKDEKV